MVLNHWIVGAESLDVGAESLDVGAESLKYQVVNGKHDMVARCYNNETFLTLSPLHRYFNYGILFHKLC